MKQIKPTIIFLFLLFFYSGCKKDEIVQPPINNDPVENGLILTEPLNNATVNNLNPLLKWNAFSGTIAYHIQLSMDANFLSQNLVDTTITVTEINVPLGKLTTNIYYYWRVKADLGSGNNTAWSQVRKFKVILTPPPPPVLLVPLNNSANQHYLPLFDWEDSPTADYYRLQVSLNSSFLPILMDIGSIPVSQLQCPYYYLVTGTNYFWRVNGTNSNGLSTGNWSTVFNFRTIEGVTPSSISGTIRFADSNFVQPPNIYKVGIYNTSNWPPVIQFPLRSDSLIIQRVNNEYIANYRMINVPNGNYHVTVMIYRRLIYNDIIHKSVYGCDTSRVLFSNCPLLKPGIVTINNGAGVNNINMLSWADSSKSIF